MGKGRIYCAATLGLVACLVATALVEAACTGADPSPSDPTEEPDASSGAVDAQIREDGEAPGDDDGGPDAGEPRCNPNMPFGMRKPLGGPAFGRAGDLGARLSGDEKTMYVSRVEPDGGVGSYDTWVATRTSANGSFGTPLLLNGGNTTDDEQFPTLTADGLTLYVMAFPGGTWNIHRAVRSTPNEPFPVPSNLDGVSSASANDDYPYVLANGSALFFDSDRSGVYQVYRSAVSSGVVAAPMLVPGISAADKNALAPWVSADELTVYLGSSRPGATGIDIYVARRSTVASAFGAPVRVPELSTPGTDIPSWFSEDDCVAVWSSNVDLDGATGPMRVYTSERPK